MCFDYQKSYSQGKNIKDQFPPSPVNTYHSSMNNTEVYLIERRAISPLFPLVDMVCFSTFTVKVFSTKTTALWHLKYILNITEVIVYQGKPVVS